MSQVITCPNCNHIFESDDLFEKYEKIVERITQGKRTPIGATAIDVIGKDGTSYQVKYSTETKKYKSCSSTKFHWFIICNRIMADFFVLFGISKETEYMFIVPSAIVIKRSFKIKHANYHNQQRNYLSTNTTRGSWIWSYYTSPDNFIRRVQELKINQQLALEFTRGLGD